MQPSRKTARRSSTRVTSTDVGARPRPPVVRLNDPTKMKLSIERFGNEKNPILVVDDVLANADEIREFALGVQYDRALMNRAYYPGYIASCPLRGVEEVGRWAGRYLWSEGYRLDADEQTSQLSRLAVNSFFAVFAPEKNTKYGIVHSDAHSWLAMLIYLTPNEEKASGTGFWRHVPTGLESGCSGAGDPFSLMLRLDSILGTKLIDSARRALEHAPQFSYARWLQDIFSQSTPPFPSGDHGPWEKIGTVAAKFNRLVVYPTFQFHSVVMKREKLASTLDTARLTLNVFIKHPLFEEMEKPFPIGPMSGI
jgi:hypothetical protein